MNKFIRIMVINALCMAAVPMQGSHTAVVHRWSVRSVVDSVVKAVWTNRSREARIGGVSALVVGLGSLALWYITKPSAETTVPRDESARAKSQLSDNAAIIQVIIDQVSAYPTNMTIHVRIEDQGLIKLIGGTSGQVFTISCGSGEPPSRIIYRLFKELIRSHKTNIEKIASLGLTYSNELCNRLMNSNDEVLTQVGFINGATCILKAAPSVGDLD